MAVVSPDSLRWKVNASLNPLLRQNASAAGLPQLVPHSRQTSSRWPLHTGLAKMRFLGIGSWHVTYANGVQKLVYDVVR